MSGLEVAAILAGVPVLLSAFEYFQSADDKLRDLSKQDNKFDLLSAQFAVEQKRFELIIERLLLRLLPDADTKALFANGNGTFDFASIQDPKISSALYKGLGEHAELFVTIVSGMQESIEHSGLIMRAESKNPGEKPYLNSSIEVGRVSRKCWEGLIRNLNAYNSALTSTLEVDVPAYGAYSGDLEFRDDLEDLAAKLERSIELQELPATSSQPVTGSESSRLRSKTKLDSIEAKETAHQSSLLRIGGSVTRRNDVNADTVCPIHPDRNIRSCPRECGWQIEGENELANAIKVIQRLQEARVSLAAEQRSNKSSKSKKRFIDVKICYILIFLGVLTISSSLGAALWRSESMNDLSGGFSLAQYILGVGIFIVGSMVALHAKRCTCWQS